MSSIPLVALSVKPQQFQDPVENDTRAMQLKALGQQTQQQAALAPGQQQLQQQAIQSGQQTIQQQQTTNQQQQLALQDQMTMRSLASKYIKKDDEGNATGFDFNGFAQDAASKGVNPATVQQIQLQHAQTVKGLADADETTRNNEIAKNKQSYEVLEGLKGLPDQQQKAAAYPSAVQQLQKLGIDTSRFPQTYPGDQGVTDFETGLGMHQQILDDSKKVSDINKSNADEFKEVPGTGMFFNPLTSETKTAAGATMSPQMMEGKYIQVQQAQKLGQPVSAADQAFAQSYEKMKTLVPALNFNLQNAIPGSTPNAPLSDKVIDALGAPNSQLKLQDVLPPRAPESVRQAALNQVLAKYPDYSTKTYQIGEKVLQSATSGQIGQNLTAFNTAIEHAKQLSTATDALDKGNIRALNQIGNTLGYQFGSDKTTNFNVIKNALSGEISKVFKGGGATDAEIEAVQAPFSAANSPEQLKGAINAAVSLMNSKKAALQQQVEQGVQGKPNFGGGAQGGGQTQSGAPATSNSSDPFAQFGGKKH